MIGGSIDRTVLNSRAQRVQKQEQLDDYIRNNRRGHSINMGNGQRNHVDMN